jgi:PAS domain S-box-containing protein
MNEVPSTLVLIVDDDPGIRALLRRILSQDGYLIEEAEDGEQALEMCERLQPAIILLDIMLPRLDGIEVCRKLHTQGKTEDCAILMITSLNDEQSVDRAFELGAVDYIRKPLNLPVLRQRVRHLAAGQQAQEAVKKAHAQLEERVVQRTAELKAANEVLQHEIAERKRAEESVRLYADVVRNMPIGMFVWQLAEGGDTPLFRLVAANPSAEKIFGLASADLIGKTLSETFPALLHTDLRGIAAEVIRTGQARDLGAVQYGDENASTFMLSVFALPDRCVGITAEDMTTRKHMENALYQSEQQLRRITDNMLDIICQTDIGGNILFASPSCWDVLGYTPDSLRGQSIYAGVHPDDLAMVIDAIQTTGRVEYRYQHADGHYLWLETLSNFLFEGDAIPQGIIFASREITKRKQAEWELKELNRLKTEFLTTAAHELRTPLTSIRGFSELLLARKWPSDRQQRYLHMIHEQANHLGVLIDDLLDISRLEAKRTLTLALEPVNIFDLVERILPPIVEAAPAHEVEIEGLQGCPPVLGDPMRLGQVIQNLVANAVKYSPNGGKITIRGRTVDSCLEFSIQDQGIGMTPDQHAHLFEKFYRADGSNNAVQGTGLGLSISKLIIELHHGQIWAESEYGVGSTFFFTVPLAAKQDQPSPQPSPN